jgi:hypothetical protein
MKYRLLFPLSLILALACSFFNNYQGAFGNALFNLALSGREAERELIAASIRQYNINSASFYSSGGFLAGLDEIPASPYLKRRLFKDITMLKGDGLVMVFDRDRVEVGDIAFLNRDYAVAETHEVWAVGLQDMATRKPIMSVKASSVRARYVLHREDFPGLGETWVIYEVDVYPQDEPVPPLITEPAL